MSEETFTKPERRRRYFVIALWVGMIAYTFLIPGTSAEGIYQCPFHVVTGFDCPGCGMTRASVHALHGDLLTSLQYHPLGVVFVIGLTLLAGWRAAELVKGSALRPKFLEPVRKREKGIWLAVLIVAATFGFGRLLLQIVGILTPL